MAIVIPSTSLYQQYNIFRYVCLSVSLCSAVPEKTLPNLIAADEIAIKVVKYAVYKTHETIKQLSM